jgi:hypothetical protein
MTDHGKAKVFFKNEVLAFYQESGESVARSAVKAIFALYTRLESRVNEAAPRRPQAGKCP